MSSTSYPEVVEVEEEEVENRNSISSSARSVDVARFMSGDSDRRTEDEPVGSLSDCNGARSVLTIPASRTREPQRGIE